MPKQMPAYSTICKKLPVEIPTHACVQEAHDSDAQSFPRKGLLFTLEGEARYITNDATVIKSKPSIFSTIVS